MQPGVLLLVSHSGRRLELWASEPPFFLFSFAHTLDREVCYSYLNHQETELTGIKIAFFLVFRNLFGINLKHKQQAYHLTFAFIFSPTVQHFNTFKTQKKS